MYNISRCVVCESFDTYTCEIHQLPGQLFKQGSTQNWEQIQFTFMELLGTISTTGPVINIWWSRKLLFMFSCNHVVQIPAHISKSQHTSLQINKLFQTARDCRCSKRIQFCLGFKHYQLLLKYNTVAYFRYVGNTVTIYNSNMNPVACRIASGLWPFSKWPLCSAVLMISRAQWNQGEIFHRDRNRTTRKLKRTVFISQQSWAPHNCLHCYILEIYLETSLVPLTGLVVIILTIVFWRFEATDHIYEERPTWTLRQVETCLTTHRGC